MRYNKRVPGGQLINPNAHLSHISDILDKKITRREAVRVLALTSAVLYLKGCSSAPYRAIFQAGQGFSLNQHGPLNPLFNHTTAPQAFFGDQPHRAHAVLWNPHGSRSISDVKQERVKVTIVGGGISGLTMAYLLREYRPVLLEQSDRLGGNAQSQLWRDSAFPIGAAYYMQPNPKSSLARLYKEWGLDEISLSPSEEAPYLHNGTWWSDSKAQVPSGSAALSNRLEQYFENVFEEKEGRVFPDYPTDSSTLRSQLNQLDRISFLEHLRQVLGVRDIPSEVLAPLELYFYSAFNGSTAEISALAGLNFYAGENAGIRVAPGGNGGVADCILKKTLETLPANSFRPSSIVYAVRREEGVVRVQYRDEKNENRELVSDVVVMACPKFVVKRILRDLEGPRQRAIEELEYRSYLVGVALVDGALPRRFYDAYSYKEGVFEQGMSFRNRRAMDYLWGNYSLTPQGQTALCLYKPLPFQSGRAELLSSSYETIRDQFQKQIFEEVLPAMQWQEKQLKELRIARWGHALCLARPGLVAKGVVDQLRKPHHDRVFFVHQDNWVLPAMESSITEALLWAPKIQKRLQV